LGQVVTQAQKEFNRLTAEDAQPPSAKGKEKASPHDTCPVEESSSGDASASAGSESETSFVSASTAQTFFSRLQSAVPANVVSAVQSNLPDGVKQASENIDFNQMRQTLVSEFNRVQGITRLQAEEYVHRSEALLKSVMKEAEEAFRDAVKVIPPDHSGQVPSRALVWDGVDMWMLPSDETFPPGEKSAGHAISSVATRADALLKRLRRDPEIIKRNPESDADAQRLYLDWSSTALDMDEHGIEAEQWKTKITAALQDAEDGETLQKTLDSLGLFYRGLQLSTDCDIPLVPSTMSADTFWKRYFFRVHQIEHERERRKMVLQG
jgi:hypothetical protein